MLKHSEFLTSIFIPAANIPPLRLKDVAIYCCHFNQSYFSAELFDIFSIDCPKDIVNAVTKRQAEFLAGRIMVQLAFKALGVAQTDISIGRHRSPQWPLGISGSISHSQHIAICVVRRGDLHNYVGVDVESVISISTMEKISSSIVNANEIRLINAINLARNVVFTLIFSAKESLFKALYPSVGYYFDFNAAEVTAICLEQGQFTIKLKQPLTDHLTAGLEFRGFFTIHAAYVTTYLI